MNCSCKCCAVVQHVVILHAQWPGVPSISAQNCFGWPSCGASEQVHMIESGRCYYMVNHKQSKAESLFNSQHPA